MVNFKKHILSIGILISFIFIAVSSQTGVEEFDCTQAGMFKWTFICEPIPETIQDNTIFLTIKDKKNEEPVVGIDIEINTIYILTQMVECENICYGILTLNNGNDIPYADYSDENGQADFKLTGFSFKEKSEALGAQIRITDPGGIYAPVTKIARFNYQKNYYQNTIFLLKNDEL